MERVKQRLPDDCSQLKAPTTEPNHHPIFTIEYEYS